jgi:hypothetical protein
LTAIFLLDVPVLIITIIVNKAFPGRGEEMKKRFLAPVLLLLFISLACNLSNFQSSTQESTQASLVASPLAMQTLETALPQATIAVLLPSKQPTQEITEAPTAEPTVEETQAAPSPEPTQACAPYGIEEFDSSSPCWPSTLEEMTAITALTNSPNEFAGINNGRLEFKHVVADEVYLYAFNQQNQYDQVIMEATIVKIEPSSNQNGATLACHVNETGWYEVRIESGGTFHVFQYDAAKKAIGGNPYSLRAEGGAPALIVGADAQNVVRWSCAENVLTLTINGKETWTQEFNDMISGGGIGLGMASYSGKFPLHIAFERLEIIEP